MTPAQGAKPVIAIDEAADGSRPVVLRTRKQ